MDAASCFFCNFCLSTLAGVMRARAALGKPHRRGSIAQSFCESAGLSAGRSNMGAEATAPKA